MTTQRFRYLLNNWLLGTISPQEAVELMENFSEPEYQLIVEEYLETDFNKKNFSGLSSVEMKTLALQEIKEKITRETGKTRPVHRVHFLKTAWLRYAAAIIILFGSGTAIYLWNTQQRRTDTASRKPVPVKDIKPGGQRAVLTLADGSIILLDSAANGQLAVQQGSTVTKKDGHIIYNSLNSLNPRSIVLNTMSTPRGGQYQLTLPDGTTAWLNAASAITYPTVFSGQNREVKITGEVYFEVAKNKERPFIVNTVKESITVLGTSFNVNSYTDEPSGKISLLEGSIKVNDRLLKPGQAYTNGKITATDIEQDVAWKNGVFNFQGQSLREIMRQLSRWYGISVSYADNVPDKTYYGKMNRNLNLSQVLALLQTAGLHSELQGNNLHILP